MIRVTIWEEYVRGRTQPDIIRWYPAGIHEYIAAFLCEGKTYEVKTACLDEPEHGLTEDVLDKTDVLVWWGHAAHDLVQDAVVERVYEHVLRGMGLVALHSSHDSKIF